MCILFGNLQCHQYTIIPIFCLCCCKRVRLYLNFVGDEDFVAEPTVPTIVLSGSETRKCVNITIIDDQIVEKTEPFAVTITFPANQSALQSDEIVPREMQINGRINIIDDDGELI